MLSTAMMPSHYQMLADRGWRRYSSLIRHVHAFALLDGPVAYCPVTIDPEHFTINLMSARLVVLIIQYGKLNTMTLM